MVKKIIRHEIGNSPRNHDARKQPAPDVTDETAERIRKALAEAAGETGAQNCGFIISAAGTGWSASVAAGIMAALAATAGVRG